MIVLHYGKYLGGPLETSEKRAGGRTLTPFPHIPMCIIFSTAEDAQLNSYSLILAGNRDEFLGRPTTGAGWHSFHSIKSDQDLFEEPSEDVRVLSGIDLTGGGTWMGSFIGKASSPFALRFATLTNVTETHDTVARPSRGDLVKGFLTEEAEGTSMEKYLQSIEHSKAAYAGFNLLLVEISRSHAIKRGYISNREDMPWRIVGDSSAGSDVICFSNSTLSNKVVYPDGQSVTGVWPKVRKGSEIFEDIVHNKSTTEDELCNVLYELLSTHPVTPVEHRTHLRYTVLVRPVYMDPMEPVPVEPLPFDETCEDCVYDSRVDFADSSDASRLPKESETIHWYATRVQSIFLVGAPDPSTNKRNIVFKERQAFVLDSKSSLPVWSGAETVYRFSV